MNTELKKIPKISVSCQIPFNDKDPHDLNILRDLVDRVILSGISSVRLNDPEIISYVKGKYSHVFILGLEKIYAKESPGSGFVTPDFDSAKKIIDAGVNCIIIEASNLLHAEETLGNLIKSIKKYKNILIGCDTGTLEEAKRAFSLGADFVLTTFAQAQTREGKNFSYHIDLVKKISSLNIPVIAEGGIENYSQANQLLFAGAFSVVVGRSLVSIQHKIKEFIKSELGNKNDYIKSFFNQHILSSENLKIEALDPHGSSREYFKIISEHGVYLATMSFDTLENESFIRLSHHLRKSGINAPVVFCSNTEKTFYIQEYKGEKDLYSYVVDNKISTDQKEKLLKQVIDLLVDFQDKGSIGIDYLKCYPFSIFNNEEILRDVKRFKEKFLNKSNISFNDELFEKDIDSLIQEIDKIPEKEYCLMHRDFQSRNIIVGDSDNKFSLIDFQNARKGPLYYDFVSLIFQSQVNYSEELIETLINYFFNKKNFTNKEHFLRNMYLVAIIRMIQTIGSYGIGGLEQGKIYFIKSISFALNNFLHILSKTENMGYSFPEIKKVINVSKQTYDSNK